MRPLEFALVLFGLAILRGFAEGVAFGNASVGLAGLLAWCWVIGRGRPLVGLLAGLGATIKLVPGAAVFWSTRRTFLRVVLDGRVAVGGALFVLTLPLVGIQSWFDYAKALSFSDTGMRRGAARIRGRAPSSRSSGPARRSWPGSRSRSSPVAWPSSPAAPLLSFALVVDGMAVARDRPALPLPVRRLRPRGRCLCLVAGARRKPAEWRFHRYGAAGGLTKQSVRSARTWTVAWASR